MKRKQKQPPIRRRADWPGRLAAAIEAGRKTGFVWGENDCCLFAANVVLAMTGYDPARGMRGYTTAAGAAAKLKQHGGVAAIAADGAMRHGWPEIPPAEARRGDVVLVEDNNGAALGVVDLSGRWIIQPAAAKGLAARPLLRAGLRAWRIG
jgi:hypothetical protein